MDDGEYPMCVVTLLAVTNGDRGDIVFKAQPVFLSAQNIVELVIFPQKASFCEDALQFE